jgi:hypothetical protein
MEQQMKVLVIGNGGREHALAWNDAVFVSGGNHFVVADRAARLNNAGDADRCRGVNPVGIGAGQMSRVYSAKIAGIKAGDEGLEVKGSAMAFDEFRHFPAEQRIAQLLLARLTFADHAQFTRGDQQYDHRHRCRPDEPRLLGENRRD